MRPILRRLRLSLFLPTLPPWGAVALTSHRSSDGAASAIKVSVQCCCFQFCEGSWSRSCTKVSYLLSSISYTRSPLLCLLLSLLSSLLSPISFLLSSLLSPLLSSILSSPLSCLLSPLSSLVSTLLFSSLLSPPSLLSSLFSPLSFPPSKGDSSAFRDHDPPDPRDCSHF